MEYFIAKAREGCGKISGTRTAAAYTEAKDQKGEAGQDKSYQNKREAKAT